MSLVTTVTAVPRRLVVISRERGVLSVVRSCLRWGFDWLRRVARAGRTSGETFTWDGRPVPYFEHRYNYTWLNERAVEIALALEILQEHAGEEVLEIGNVLGHYVAVDHLVVDKYERSPGVVNTDVAEFTTDQRFDLVLAVSTLEHVGLDEDVLDPGKAALAIDHLKSLLRPGGVLWVTLPVDYNVDLDRQLRAGELGFTRVRALCREERRNRWSEVPVDQVWQARYDRLLYTAHGVVVGEYVAEPGSRRGRSRENMF